VGRHDGRSPERRGKSYRLAFRAGHPRLWASPREIKVHESPGGEKKRENGTKSGNDRVKGLRRGVLRGGNSSISSVRGKKKSLQKKRLKYREKNLRKKALAEGR